MALSNYASRPGTEEERDESYKKIVDKRNIPDIGKGSLYFHFLSLEDEAFFHGMEFWLNLGKKKDGSKDLTLPRISPNPFTDFVGSNERTGAVFVSWKNAKNKCPLSKLTDENHPLIVKQSFRGGEPKPNVSAFHAARIQLIEPQRDKAGKVIKDEKGLPKFTVLPEERILKMTQNWWDQLVRLVEPEAVQVADDGFSDAAAAKPKTFPAKDLTKVVFMLRKERKTKNPSPDPALNVEYILDFSEKIVLSNTPTIPEESVEYGKVFKAITAEELKDFKKKHEESKDEDDHRDPKSYGESMDDEEPASKESRVPQDGSDGFE